MLVSSQTGTVDSTYVPGLGEEVYNTISLNSYRGNGYDQVSELTPISGGGGEITSLKCPDSGGTGVLVPPINGDWTNVRVVAYIFTRGTSSGFLGMSFSATGICFNNDISEDVEVLVDISAPADGDTYSLTIYEVWADLVIDPESGGIYLDVQPDTEVEGATFGTTDDYYGTQYRVYKVNA